MSVTEPTTDGQILERSAKLEARAAALRATVLELAERLGCADEVWSSIEKAFGGWITET